ncbi:PfkB family carbohydrate kinase [Mangrovibrevibacter kandeliae]|uniref:PfkB family carbohydrate kinase n=1 Tax=Mangrovibrevibacter kandeliae TaxID=2968473 RepID=UPI0021176C08|nr:PfkB family carbohydrate kinase [Aurantimonas sp. CSK15Z-1]MCQ8782837.1 PfkB family carbohydrate kinase [Aurantimonas sp. CSK15Z-1]
MPHRHGSDHPGAGTNSKIVPIQSIGDVMDDLRRQGRRVVLCHGVFDLVHVGHIRHLKAAQRFGDVLVVSITADEHVNKGPDRPAFTSTLRAEFLASLEFVSYVTVVDAPSAAPAINAIKPAFYVKGGEYVDAKDDITGKITAERELVEHAGGQLVFTDDITFSSSNLLNKHFAGRDEALDGYLSEQREAGLEKRVASLFERIGQMRIVVVGETIIDRYTYVAPMGKAAKENIIATLYKSEEEFAGGAVASANHLSAVCPNVELITMLGDPSLGENYEDLVRDNLDPSITLTPIYRPGGPTVQKTRFVEPTYVRKLFEVYHMDDHPLEAEVQAEFHERLRASIRDADLVIVNDFGHGFISGATVSLLREEAKFLAINVQSNAGNIGYNLITKYPSADFVCIDAMEAWLAIQNKHADLADVVERRLPAIIDCPNIIVTHGRSGCFASTENGALRVPAFSKVVVDTVGAGDAFFVIAAPALAAGADCATAAFVGNVAGAISIGIVGHRRYLNKIEILRYVTTLLK